MSTDLKGKKKEPVILTQNLLLDYLELTKPKLILLVIISALVGFFLASGSILNLRLFFGLLVGSALVSGGSMVLNQWMERGSDALMIRTENRPIPAKRVEPNEALAFGFVLSLVGLGVLDVTTTHMCALIALITLLSYLFIYTPSKKRTDFSTLLGAIPGALPPVMGWAAVESVWKPEPWLIFALMFVWQMPHFYAIAWICREDYKKAGFKVISVTHPEGLKVAKHILAYTLVLIPVSLMPSWFGFTGELYLFCGIVLNTFMFLVAIRCLEDMDKNTKLLFRASVVYLPLIFILLLFDWRAS